LNIKSGISVDLPLTIHADSRKFVAEGVFDFPIPAIPCDSGDLTLLVALYVFM